MGRIWGSRERHGDVGRGARRGGSHSGLPAYCTDLSLWQKRGSQSHLSEMGAPEGPEQRLIGPDLLFNKITPDTVLKIDYGWLGRRRVAGTQTDGVSCQGDRGGDGTALRLGVVSLQRRPPPSGGHGCGAEGRGGPTARACVVRARAGCPGLWSGRKTLAEGPEREGRGAAGRTGTDTAQGGTVEFGSGYREGVDQAGGVSPELLGACEAVVAGVHPEAECRQAAVEADAPRQ